MDPRVFVLDASRLSALRRRVISGDEILLPAVARLRREADEALGRGPYSVVHKDSPPPSGDLHDYTSIGPYWWPDPKRADGKPYIRRDGEMNPERRRIGDADRFGDLMRDSVTLALAWWYTGHPPYAERAALLLRTWYLDPATRMNPHMTYAQAIPGRCDGRGIGIVDAGSQIHVIDAVGLLADSPAWTEADQAALVAWFGAFLTWLLESPHGRDEDRTGNNHATQYDAQVACYALFTGRNDVATKVLEAVPRRRLAAQVRPDGSQPQELARTKSWGYSCANTRNLVNLALLAERVGIDLWQAEGGHGAGIRKAIDYLLPYAAGEKAWPHTQITRLDPDALFVSLRLAAERYGDATFQR
ncbi:MAG: alginate lyase family protein, partial [Lentisphaeria bacterium]|nr:alginate lyase family protein [Lentisphaeria bacterium]